MKKMTVFVLGLIAVLIFCAQGHTQMMGHGGKMMGHGMGMGHGVGPETMGGELSTHQWSLTGVLHHWGRYLFAQKDRLGLTDDQIRRMQSSIMDHVKFSIPKIAERKLLLLEIQEMLLKEEIVLPEVEKKLKSIEEIDTQMGKEGIATFQKVLSVLNPEQQKEFRGLITDLTFARHMRMGSGGMMEKED